MTVPSRRRGGFTLVELLVATMLLTIVMTAVYTLFFSVIQSWRSIEHDDGHHRKARNVITVIQNEYAQAYAPAAYLMEGTEEELTLFTLASPHRIEDNKGTHLLRIRYRFHDGDLEREEARVTTPLPQAIGDPDAFDRNHIDVENQERVVIARGLHAFSFHYIWMPQPPWTPGFNPPEPVIPIVATHHKVQWGFPQALEICVSYADEPNLPFEATSRIPTQVGSPRRERYQLVNMLGDGL